MTDFKHGSVKISNLIIDQLIAETALKVEGVNTVIGYKNQKVEANKKDGISTIIENDTMTVDLNLLLDNEVNIYDTCEKVQESIKEQVRVMLGIDVKEVNIVVKDLVFKK